jgi:hypothetical protein
LNGAKKTPPVILDFQIEGLMGIQQQGVLTIILTHTIKALYKRRSVKFLQRLRRNNNYKERSKHVLEQPALIKTLKGLIAIKPLKCRPRFFPDDASL